MSVGNLGQVPRHTLHFELGDRQLVFGSPGDFGSIAERMVTFQILTVYGDDDYKSLLIEINLHTMDISVFSMCFASIDSDRTCPISLTAITTAALVCMTVVAFDGDTASAFPSFWLSVSTPTHSCQNMTHLPFLHHCL